MMWCYMNHKILFISAPVGAGHIRAAQAVISSLTKGNLQIVTKMANVFDFFNPSLGKVILNTYLKILELFPQMYGAAYKLGNDSKIMLLGRKIISRYLAGKMEKYIMEYNPQVIVCTHATPTGLVAHLLKENKISIPVVAVVTDFILHRLWIYPEIKHYVVAHEGMKNFLMAQGIEHNAIKVLGIPVEERFSIPVTKQSIFEKLGLDCNQKTLLIMGGGAGMLPMDKIVLCCEKIKEVFQILVVTGNNTKMYTKLLTLQPKLRNKVKIFGYVDSIHELMTISQLIISKPGGMTTAETLCKGLPIIIYQPIPGQEEGNTNYLMQAKAALRADSLEEIERIIRRLLVEKPEELANLKQNALAISKGKAAEEIADYILAQV